ncbi:hypothetical protein CGRA01v4_06855 [Colletotrichum graminicola]|uniref:Tat pathway signal sequence n=1 Tax=Colletotrichum graminicola (strain M1.001 / M2 / FGSC 10212) TaxID=645133 RepID=E3Q2R5_COLGM|nr:uncharacterized protein GLRG_00038 [Colletotrichum graminicola M1.001]EFQ24894.1 hypothetical protein GLRG_00038 [Colletotrichum graminicola M1.001]WDK15574.1 hypothetical protein CGRA01v4_06855 [Colletotrichum graminicola]
MESKETSYKPLMSEETRDSESLEGSMYSINGAPKHRLWSKWKLRLQSLYMGHTSFLCLVVLSMAFGFAFSVLRAPSDQDCARQLSMWSPVLDAVEYIQYDFDDAFNSTSIYRGPPTPEREQAWFDLTYKHAVEIPQDKISGLNRSEEDHLERVSEEEGSGYVALIEVFHQLHCLNMVRMYTWLQAGKYDKPPLGLAFDPLKNRIHVDHCIEALRISLMCFADVTPLFVRLGGPLGKRADFETHHKCRNFTKIEQWMDENWTVR